LGDTNVSTKQFRWFTIALIAFNTVWGFNNVVNNYAQQGASVITSWVIILIIYFIPYTLMVGQLGSTFKKSGGGVSSWIDETSTRGLAYFAAWTYWVVHVPYLAQKPQNVLIAISWAFTGAGTYFSHFSTAIFSILCLIVFLFFMWVASKGITTLGVIATLAGLATFVMSILFIFLAIAAPHLPNVTAATPHLTSVKTYIPNFNFGYFTTLSMLVLAVGGSEKIAPYVNKTRNASREFPLGMIILAVLVGICAIVGSIGMAIIFNSNAIPKDLMMNGAYSAFQRLGQYYHIGNSLMITYGLTNSIGQIAALIVSIDAPLRILLSGHNDQYVPKSLMKLNKHGVFINGYKMTGVLVGILIMVPALGIKNIQELYNWLLNLNSIVMPLRYLWVFVAFMLLSKHMTKFHSDYRFVKNKTIGWLLGFWCFIFTAFVCVLGMVPKISFSANPHSWFLQLGMNIVTPIVLIALGLIMPMIARRNKNK
jgi:amino acid transporter